MFSIASLNSPKIPRKLCMQEQDQDQDFLKFLCYRQIVGEAKYKSVV